jgi:hypothetical protein
MIDAKVSCKPLLEAVSATCAAVAAPKMVSLEDVLVGVDLGLRG